MTPSADVSLPQLHHGFPTAAALPSRSSATTQVHSITDDTSQLRDKSPSGRKTLILNPSFITRDFDALRFEAAAHHQLPLPASTSSTPGSDSDPDSDFSPAYSTNLIASPYNSPGHYLDITTLPPASRLFALALTALKPTTATYATAPYTASLNFPTVLDVLRNLSAREGFAWPETSFYVVVFRSKLRRGVDQELLYRLDYESHAEACEQGGLLKYWFGKADLQADRRNLATCFWRSPEHASRGGSGPWHAKARRAGSELYESIVFSTHRFTVLDGVTGYRFEDWKD